MSAISDTLGTEEASTEVKLLRWGNTWGRGGLGDDLFCFTTLHEAVLCINNLSADKLCVCVCVSDWVQSASSE